MKVALIVNPAAGGGRCGTRADAVVERLRGAGLDVAVRRTTGPGDAVAFARLEAERGADRVVAVGGDGTLHEVVNGLLQVPGTKAELAILPLGTGNSFARDFGLQDPIVAEKALTTGAARPIDALRVRHAGGELFSVNLVSLGFVADVGDVTNRRFKRLGAVGYVAGTFVAVARMKRPVVPIAVDGGADDARPAVFLCFCNSQYTGGAMRMAPAADPTDGQLDVIRVGTMGRSRLLWLFPRIFKGTHVEAREIEATRGRTVTLRSDGPLAVLVDGEALQLELREVAVAPGALRLVVPA